VKPRGEIMARVNAIGTEFEEKDVDDIVRLL
jgi:hypothetical protein